MTEILSHYEPITLDEMNDIRLMNRIDTKFVTTVPVLKRLLDMARDDYFVSMRFISRMSFISSSVMGS